MGYLLPANAVRQSAGTGSHFLASIIPPIPLAKKYNRQSMTEVSSKG
jgi:hypothetical protein